MRMKVDKVGEDILFSIRPRENFLSRLFCFLLGVVTILFFLPLFIVGGISVNGKRMSW